MSFEGKNFEKDKVLGAVLECKSMQIWLGNEYLCMFIYYIFRRPTRKHS